MLTWDFFKAWHSHQSLTKHISGAYLLSRAGSMWRYSGGAVIFASMNFRAYCHPIIIVKILLCPWGSFLSYMQLWVEKHIRKKTTEAAKIFKRTPAVNGMTNTNFISYAKLPFNSPLNFLNSDYLKTNPLTLSVHCHLFP